MGIAGEKPLSQHELGNPGPRAPGSISLKSRISGGDGGGQMELMMREGISLLIASIFLSDKKQDY